MKNMFRGPHARVARWAAGVTLAGFLAGGGVAFAAGGDGAGSGASLGASTGANVGASAGQSAASVSKAQLSALLTASRLPASRLAASRLTSSRLAASGRQATAGHPLIRTRRGRLRRLGGMYGSFTFHATSGDQTLAFERGTIQSVTGSNIVVRAADGTTMTWLLGNDTVVRDRGPSSTNHLSSGQAVFVGGPVSGAARDARLIAVRPAASTPAPAS